MSSIHCQVWESSGTCLAESDMSVTQRDLKKSELSSQAKLCVRWILGYDHPMKRVNELNVRLEEVLKVTVGESGNIWWLHLTEKLFWVTLIDCAWNARYTGRCISAQSSQTKDKWSSLSLGEHKPTNSWYCLWSWKATTSTVDSFAKTSASGNFIVLPERAHLLLTQRSRSAEYVCLLQSNHWETDEHYVLLFANITKLN
jgi:hypothetical protein